MPILVDTSAILALIDTSSHDHAAVRDSVVSSRDALLVPVTVVPEADYLLVNRVSPRVAIAFLESVDRGEFHLTGLTEADFHRAVELVNQYAGSDIGFVDASIVAIAERLGIGRILTLDHRHFGMIRPKHRPAFELIP